MYNNLKYHIDDLKRRVNVFKENLDRIRGGLLLEKTGPLETIAIYFKTLELVYDIENIIKVRNEYKKLGLFATPFDEKRFIPVNTLWLVVENIKGQKDNFNSFMDMDFLKSKGRTLRLWDYDIPETIKLYEKTIQTLEGYIDNAPEVWYNMYKHLEGPEFFLDKETMSMYELEHFDTNIFEFNTLIYNEQREACKTQVKISLDGKIDKFFEKILTEHYPEYLL